MIPREVINHQQFFQVCLIVLVVSLLGRAELLDCAKLGGMEPVISLILFHDIQPIFNANLRIPHKGHFGVGSGGYL